MSQSVPGVTTNHANAKLTGFKRTIVALAGGARATGAAFRARLTEFELRRQMLLKVRGVFMFVMMVRVGRQPLEVQLCCCFQQRDAQGQADVCRLSVVCERRLFGTIEVLHSGFVCRSPPAGTVSTSEYSSREKIVQRAVVEANRATRPLVVTANKASFAAVTIQVAKADPGRAIGHRDCPFAVIVFRRPHEALAAGR